MNKVGEVILGEGACQPPYARSLLFLHGTDHATFRAMRFAFTRECQCRRLTWQGRLAVAVVLLMSGAFFFRRMEKSFADVV